MANLGFNLLINGASGKLNKKDNTVLRQKKYRNEDGAVTGLAKPEGYAVLFPRDFKKKPQQGAELQNVLTFKQASTLTTLILKAGRMTETEIAALPESKRAQTEELRAQYLQFKARFDAQLKTPDPEAPLLKPTDPDYNRNSSKPQHKQYKALNNFIRAMLIQSLRSI